MPDTVTPLSIHITERAAKKVAFFAEKDAKGSAFGLRVGVKGGGCSGLTYTLSVESGPQEEDKIIEDQGIRLFVPKKSFVFLGWHGVGLLRRLERQGVRIQQPECQEHLRLRDQLLRLDHSRHTKGRPPALRWTAAFVYARKRECRQPRYSRRTIQLNAAFSEVAGWAIPEHFGNVAAEYDAARTGAAIADASHHVVASSQGERTPSTCSIG